MRTFRLVAGYFGGPSAGECSAKQRLGGISRGGSWGTSSNSCTNSSMQSDPAGSSTLERDRAEAGSSYAQATGGAAINTAATICTKYAPHPARRRIELLSRFDDVIHGHSAIQRRIVTREWHHPAS